MNEYTQYDEEQLNDSLKHNNNLEQKQPAVEAPLNLDELNKKYPVSELCGPVNMNDIKGGLSARGWMVIFKNSPFRNTNWEKLLGGYTTGCVKNEAWEYFYLGDDFEHTQDAIELGMFREVDTDSGQKLIPTEKCLKFIQERLKQYTK